MFLFLFWSSCEIMKRKWNISFCGWSREKFVHHIKNGIFCDFFPDFFGRSLRPPASRHPGGSQAKLYFRYFDLQSYFIFFIGDDFLNDAESRVKNICNSNEQTVSRRRRYFIRVPSYKKAYKTARNLFNFFKDFLFKVENYAKQNSFF